MSFRREKYVPRGGPDGGDGGRGGSVVFLVKRNVKTLSYLKMRQRFFAQNGRPGAGRQRDGARGEDIVIEVPPGTAVYDVDTGRRLLDLTTDGARSVLLEGGRGGKGNTHFKSSRHQTPRFAQPGEEGEERRLRVELQVIADIGFVGLPNVGKSTLLKVLTAADPKIGNYPFTTVIPNLGVMHAWDRDVVLADIPGIIAGASEGAGLGLRFLKHISRTRGLAFVIEAVDPDPQATLELLQEELRQYDRSLLEKPSVVIRSKVDLLDAGLADGNSEAGEAEGAREGREAARGGEGGRQGQAVPELLEVSAMTAFGLPRLKEALVRLADVDEES